MGSLLDSSLAKLLMEYHENNWLHNLNLGKWSYIHVMLITLLYLFSCEKDNGEFLTFLSFHHPNIKLAFKNEKDIK